MRLLAVTLITAFLGVACDGATTSSAPQGTSVTISGEATANLTAKPICGPQGGSGITIAGMTVDGKPLTIQLSSVVQQITFNNLYYLLENPATVSVTYSGATLADAVFATPTNSIHEIKASGSVAC
jgi:hypothetical protein